MTFEPIGDVVNTIVDDLARSRGVIQTPITSREQWLGLRKQDVTASVAAALLGAHPYVTAYALWALKTGRIAEEEVETPAMQRGRLLEPVAIQLLKEKRPEWNVEPDGHYYRNPLWRIGATPDCRVDDPLRGKGRVQIKSVERSVFRRQWRDDETGEVEPPLWIGIQAIIEAWLTGSEWCAVAALVVGHGIDLEIVDVPIHPGVIDRVCEATREFWQMVESGKMPDPDWKRDAALAARLVQPEGAVDLSSDNALPALLDERATLSSTIRAAKELRDEIDGEIKNKLGTAAIATLPGWRITFRTVETREYTVAARKTRPLKVHRIQERETA